MFRFMLFLLLTSCNNLKDHPADCGEILECSDGSVDYDGDGYCENVFECGPDDECESVSDVNYRTPF